ncbi:CMRF35-like molecule 1 isoform X3 [Nycticebus coucang]|uniref:CMRF35-like molecule 1 isoform X3 n=1 Tax=Nycticebus coucang TaxID=9470 RepID=UPI00234C5A1E|nr:CMRF35-like molecule 1 isoform X3 [Nycticebus coucang]
MHLSTLFLLLWLSGSPNAGIRGNPITSPGAASGPERGSLTVQCHYDPVWETNRKWWCRGADWSFCKILVKTTGIEKEVKEDRVSIRDSWKDHTLTVTMEALRRDDADMYWCGIERIGVDHGVQVKVTIDPVLNAKTTTTTTTTVTITTITTFTAPVNLEKTEDSSTLTNFHSGDRLGIMRLSILLPLIFAILLLLLMIISLLAWRMMKQQKEGCAAPRGQTLLCKPDPAAERNLLQLLPEKGLREGPLRSLGGGGICHYALGSEAGSFLCISVFGHLGSGTDL